MSIQLWEEDTLKRILQVNWNFERNLSENVHFYIKFHCSKFSDKYKEDKQLQTSFSTTI